MKRGSRAKNNDGIIENKLKQAKKAGLSKNDLLDLLKTIYTSRKIDDTEISMRKQGKAYFQISSAGHEGVLVATAKAMKAGYDYFIPYYRDRALCLGLGVTPYEMLCQANGNEGDTASHGRQMPAHWGNNALNIISKSSCTGTQFLQAVGAAETGRYLSSLKEMGIDDTELSFNKDEIVYTSCGDGTTSQGEFWEALTTASVNKLPVLFMVEDNGYAISVPVDVQTPGGSISKALENFPGLKIFTCDGNCPIDSYTTLQECVKYLRAGNGPALVHANVTRPYSHSLSDDHSNYRTKEELAEEAELDVVHSFPQLLVDGGVITEKENEDLKEDVAKEVREALDKAIETPWPKPETALDHLYSHDLSMSSSEFEVEPEFSGKEDIPMAQALNSVMKSEVKRNPKIRVFGEDVADFSQLEKRYARGAKSRCSRTSF
jgi:2-oxoisovalerate dehydrogenase E1 component